jgi:outer membrane lipoprotein
MNGSHKYNKKYQYHGVGTMKQIRLLLILFLPLLVSCAHPISGEFRNQVDPDLSISQILQSPNNHIGKKVILGGVIVETRNLENVTEIEVVEKELDYTGYPSFSDQSLGRFVFRKQGYLEPEIYTKDRIVTGGGTVVGTQSGKIGEQEYEFPVIELEEIKLWDDPGYIYPPYYGPYLPGWGIYSYYPYGPYFPYRFRRFGYPYYW